MEYPNIPLCNMSRTNENKWQKFQNRTIRKLIKEEGDEDSIEELHVKYKLEAVNTRMYRRAFATWEKFADLESELAEKSMEENRNQDQKDHYWWRRMAAYLEEDDLEPRF